MIWIYDRLESAISCYSLRALKRAQFILPQLKYSSLKMQNLSLFWGVEFQIMFQFQPDST